MVRLHINIDHVATVRNARGTRYPDPVLAAQLCEAAGADGITCHLREDRRHIVDADVERLRNVVQGTLNLEMAATDEMRAIADRLRPDVVTLVPERREERTTEGGLDVARQREAIAKVARMAQAHGILLSLFVEADEGAVRLSHELGASQVELHTGELCHAFERRERDAVARELARIEAAAVLGKSLGLQVAAGHGLTRHNVGSVTAIEAIEEVNIGHSVVSDAVFVGLDRAVRDLRTAIDRSR